MKKKLINKKILIITGKSSFNLSGAIKFKSNKKKYFHILQNK